MTAARCACGQPSPSGFICNDCTKALQLALVTAAVLGPDLELATARQSRFTSPGRHTTTQPLPYDERAAEAAHALRNELAGWVRILG